MSATTTSEPLIATRANMRLCGPGTFMLTPDGTQYSASAGDYFWMAEDEPFTSEDGAVCVLVQRRAYLVHPLTGERYMRELAQ